jgi:hypothetical protein
MHIWNLRPQASVCLLVDTMSTHATIVVPFHGHLITYRSSKSSSAHTTSKQLTRQTTRSTHHLIMTFGDAGQGTK